ADLVESLRMVKSEAEIDRIRQSMDVASAAFGAVIQELRPGVSEQEIAADLDYQMRRRGADGPAFDTIVAAGERSAMPHAHPSSNRLTANQLLLIDMGAQFAGYASDMTRVVHLGKPSRKVRSLYRSVLEAQLAAIDAVKHGATAGAVDRRARGVLKQHGLDKAFVHSTGHGLGLEIHERPRLGRGEKTRLVEGMAVTVEPGVYLRGLYGIRIEDTVIVRKNGCEVLTSVSKDFAVI
ncbi:MAG: M24 family metallopeptidase, partial [Acidobacteria bacterium]|nr:M24 family metallopeptidase [Acidobacteriota bacterium]